MANTLDWRVSVDFLDLLNEVQRRRLLEGARRINQQAGNCPRVPHDAVTADLIELGLVRIYQVSEDGRQATIGYLHAGEYLGAHTASMLARVVRVVTVRTLGTIRERLAFDLLERASLIAAEPQDDAVCPSPRRVSTPRL